MSGAGSSSSTTCSCRPSRASGRRGATGSWAGLGRLALAFQPRRRARLRSALAPRRRGPRRRLADRSDLAGAGGQHGAVPGARLSAGPSDRRGGPVAVRRPRLRAALRRDGAGPGGDPRRQPPGGAHRGGALALSPRRPAAAAGAAAPARLARAEPPVRRRRPASPGGAVPPPRPVAGAWPSSASSAPARPCATAWRST